jgi:hypothetical protein
MGITAIPENAQDLIELHERQDAAALIGYQIRRSGRFTVYATKMYKYKPRHAIPIKSFKTLKDANKYLSKKLTPKKEKHDKKDTKRTRDVSSDTTKS